jgi:hypothetical protein
MRQWESQNPYETYEIYNCDIPFKTLNFEAFKNNL